MNSQETTEMVLIYSTFPDKQTAQKISEELVGLKLAACANIFGGIKSIYCWEGELQHDNEVAALFKTTVNCSTELSQKLRQLHPYDTPAIIGVNASIIEANYLSWVISQTK